MKKLLVVASFAAFAAYPAAGCDWTRAAGAGDPVVAAAPGTAAVAAVTEATPQAAPASPEARSVAVDEIARKTVGEQMPVVLITDRH